MLIVEALDSDSFKQPISVLRVLDPPVGPTVGNENRSPLFEVAYFEPRIMVGLGVERPRNYNKNLDLDKSNFKQASE